MKKLLMITMVLLAQLGFSQLPPDDKKFSMPDTPPWYEGGDKAMLKFLAENIKYPGYEVGKPYNGPAGTSYISITIATDGNITDARVLRGFDPVFDAEALRVAKLLKFNPAISGDKPVVYNMVLPVNFEPK